jgi:hypothetical protein
MALSAHARRRTFWYYYCCCCCCWLWCRCQAVVRSTLYLPAGLCTACRDSWKAPPPSPKQTPRQRRRMYVPSAVHPAAKNVHGVRTGTKYALQVVLLTACSPTFVEWSVFRPWPLSASLDTSVEAMGCSRLHRMTGSALRWDPWPPSRLQEPVVNGVLGDDLLPVCSSPDSSKNLPSSVSRSNHTRLRKPSSDDIRRNDASGDHATSVTAP